MFDLNSYCHTTQEILMTAEAGKRLLPLAPIAPLAGEGLSRLRTSSTEELLGSSITSEEFSDCFRSVFLLYFSAIDESHTISQSINSSTGSLLHGIMHRQECDFSNSKYWFRRTGRHELFSTLRETALGRLGEISNTSAKQLASEIGTKPEWDPFWFVDQCELVKENMVKKYEKLLVGVQLIEWQLIFSHCQRKASRL
jgi:hypothetical protein